MIQDLSSAREGCESPPLVRSPSDLAAASLDFGRLHIAEPQAVLRPRSAADIAVLVRWAAPQGIRVAARGRGHNGSGYAQAGGGVVVDTSALAAVHRVTPELVEMDAGCDWERVLEHTLPLGLRPPVLPSHLRLSVGGVLSAGGIGASSFRDGSAGTAVLAFELVTGAGEILTCSRDCHSELFAASLGGFGQFGILTRVTMALVPVPSRLRLCRVLYTDPAAYAGDVARLTRRPAQIESLMGSAFPNTRPWIERVMGPASRALWPRPAEFPWLLVLEVRYSPGFEDEVQSLDSIPGARYTQDCDGFIDFDPAPSNPEAHNIWLHQMVPVSHAARFLEHIFETLEVDPETDGPVAMYPIVPARIAPTAFRVPAGEDLLLFDIMPVISTGDAGRLQRVMQCLRRTDEFARKLDGMCYPVGALRYTPLDWRRHFGDAWEGMRLLKKKYDPALILSPGPGIFQPSDFA